MKLFYDIHNHMPKNAFESYLDGLPDNDETGDWLSDRENDLSKQYPLGHK